MQCEGCGDYQPCTPACPRTCDNYYRYDQIRCDESCVEGCLCPDDEVYDPEHQRCIKQESCYCIKMGVNEYYDGQTIPECSDPCRTCYCFNHTLHWFGQPCTTAMTTLLTTTTAFMSSPAVITSEGIIATTMATIITATTGTVTPATSSETPILGPLNYTTKVELGTPPPTTTLEVLTPSTEVPSPFTEVSSPSTEVPSPSTEVPSPSTEVPSPSTEVPSPSTKVPSPSTEVPSPSTEVPSPSIEVSSPSTEVLTEIITSFTSEITTPPEVSSVTPACVDTGWTDWFDTDHPWNSTMPGDFEPINRLRHYHAFCETPTDIECRNAATHVPSQLTGQVVTCSLGRGLICSNFEQSGATCDNYEVRFYCGCPTTVQPTTITEATVTKGTPEEIKLKSTVMPPVNYTTGTPLPQVTTEVETEVSSVTSVTTLTSEGTTPPTATPETTELETVTVPSSTTVSPSTVVTIAPPKCETGWTDWFNVDNPYTNSAGDFDVIPRLRKHYQFCELSKLDDAECRGTVSHIPHTELGQVVHCSQNVGLVCSNEDQYNNDTCLDYEIRFYCDCAKTTVQPGTLASTEKPTWPTPEPFVVQPAVCTETGWTDWFNIDEPGTGKMDGDFEVMPRLRTQYKFCEESMISSVECRSTESKASFESLGQEGHCTKRGFMCMNKFQTSGQLCLDYEIRFYCICVEIGTRPEITTEVTTPEEVTTTVSPKTTSVPITSETATVLETVSIVPTTYEEPIKPLNYTTEVEIGTRPEITTEVSIKPTRKLITLKPISERIVCNETGWTDWFNADSPDTNPRGDFEIIRTLRTKYQFCSVDMITDVQCRDSVTHQPPQSSLGQNVRCTPRGLMCDNNRQVPRGTTCLDYEIRFYCECVFTTPEMSTRAKVTTAVSPEISSVPTTHVSTTAATVVPTTTERLIRPLNYTTGIEFASPPESSTATKEPVAPACEETGWTKWFNVDNPYTGLMNGDYDNIPNLRKYVQFCPDYYITNVECRDVISQEAPEDHGQLVECSTTSGLICLNTYQQQCLDYEVRFFCDCGKSNFSAFLYKKRELFEL
uniref:Mucin-5AC-like n=1 Tax=Saccoglossus kowalevskii TaxID=10224 RepID=A0ABM0MKG5_SACKO|nr:PREDICTED: mucin-5AC-like [Saccoglossus kowalevskii]